MKTNIVVSTQRKIRSSDIASKMGRSVFVVVVRHYRNCGVVEVRPMVVGAAAADAHEIES
jgi:hypothetical protein